ncbi:MAG: carboxymuconolactone decarboxylase [Chloroflexi bacterium 44-23]|nr:MAG: carboxymuconolactone decarboxylase [Chloroflexi bacterium 44-23]
MEPRINYTKTAPEAYQVLIKLESYLRKTSLEPDLVELVKLRSSQINGCAYCIDMHTKDARSRGESEQRLYGVTAWRETPFYSSRERAALAWAESVTKISDNQVPDEIYNFAREHFTEKELVDLTMAVIAINAWNRLAISFHTPPGSYEPDHPVSKKNSLSKTSVDEKDNA